MEGGTFSDSESDGRPESRASYVDSDTGGSEVSPRRSQLVVGAGTGFGLAVSTGLLSGTNASRRRRRRSVGREGTVGRRQATLVIMMMMTAAMVTRGALGVSRRRGRSNTHP